MPPTTEPSIIPIGQTMIWTKSLDDYSPVDGWVLSYAFRGVGPGFNVNAIADPDSADDFLVTVADTVTATLVAGNYFWTAYVDSATLGERYLIGEGTTKVKADLSATTTATTYDGRSQAKIILDAIDAIVLGKASLDQQEYTIGDRQLRRIPIPELLALRTQYQQLYNREVIAERLRKGLPGNKTIFARFT